MAKERAGAGGEADGSADRSLRGACRLAGRKHRRVRRKIVAVRVEAFSKEFRERTEDFCRERMTRGRTPMMSSVGGYSRLRFSLYQFRWQERQAGRQASRQAARQARQEGYLVCAPSRNHSTRGSNLLNLFPLSPHFSFSLSRSPCLPPSPLLIFSAAPVRSFPRAFRFSSRGPTILSSA